jgi:hypothetical protein
MNMQFLSYYFSMALYGAKINLFFYFSKIRLIDISYFVMVPVFVI